MAAIFSLFLIFNLAALSSLLVARRWLSVYEMTVNGFFASSLAHLAFTSVSLNMKRIVYEESHLVFWVLEMARLVFLPCMYVWLLVGLFHRSIRPVQKVMLVIWWIALMVCLEQVHHRLGLTRFHQWNAGYAIFEFGFTVIVSLPFSFWFRRLLRKEGRIEW